MKTIEKKFGRISLELDPREYFPDDPGQGTPAMVYLHKNNEMIASATFWCANGTGWVDEYKLTTAEMNWLDSQFDFVEQFLESLSQKV